jgi:hypothetical protein
MNEITFNKEQPVCTQQSYVQTGDLQQDYWLARFINLLRTSSDSDPHEQAHPPHTRLSSNLIFVFFLRLVGLATKTVKRHNVHHAQLDSLTFTSWYKAATLTDTSNLQTLASACGMLAVLSVHYKPSTEGNGRSA